MTFSRLVIFAMITMLFAVIAFSMVAVGVSQGLMGLGVSRPIAGLAALVIGGFVAVRVWKFVDVQFSRNT
jgi:hypothetical protein